MSLAVAEQTVAFEVTARRSRGCTYEADCN